MFEEFEETALLEAEEGGKIKIRSVAKFRKRRLETEKKKK